MITWITNVLGTAPFDDARGEAGCTVIDVRDLVDGAGNSPSMIFEKITQALRRLEAGERVVICCDYGLSRSNAVAAGVLAKLANLSLRDAVAEVVARVGHQSISVDVLAVVGRAIDDEKSRSSSTESTMQRILVTGSTGFIGSQLIPILARRNILTCPPRKSLDLAEGAIALNFLLKEHRIQTVLHLAAPRVYGTVAALGVGAVMLEHVLAACRENQTRLVSLSSWEIYSGHRKATLASEKTPALPRGVYGRSKVLGETLIDMHARLYGLDFAVLRASPVYGPGSDKPKFLHYFLDKASRDDEIVTHRFDNGLPHLDLLHVVDLVTAIDAAVASKSQGYFNVGTGVRTSTAEIAALVCDLVGSHSKITQRDIAGCAPNVAMDARRAADLLGWRPTVGLREGIERLAKTAETVHADRQLEPLS